MSFKFLVFNFELGKPAFEKLGLFVPIQELEERVYRVGGTAIWKRPQTTSNDMQTTRNDMQTTSNDIETTW